MWGGGGGGDITGGREDGESASGLQVTPDGVEVKVVWWRSESRRIYIGEGGVRVNGDESKGGGAVRRSSMLVCADV